MANKKLKTSIKARIMRLGIISVVVCSLIMGIFAVIFAKNESGKHEVLKAGKFYYVKYKKVDIETKNILLSKFIKR